MSVRFDPRAKRILIRAVVIGPLGRGNLRLALDTGATRTTIDPARLRAVGIDQDSGSAMHPVTTASGMESAPLLEVPRVQALGIDRRKLPVLAYRLPPGAAFDGLLGLDMLRGLRLTIDFHAGTIDVD